MYMETIEQRAFQILLALLQNPERYNYISKLVEDNKLTQEEANQKNIEKAFKIANSFENKVSESHKNSQHKIQKTNINLEEIENLKEALKTSNLYLSGCAENPDFDRYSLLDRIEKNKTILNNHN